MKHAIQYSCDSHQYLTTTPRKKNICNTLLILDTGSVLIRLGKYEHILSAGEAFWIPFDCLHSLSIMPNSKLRTLSFSIRLKDSFPSEAGYFQASILMLSLCKKLDSLNGNKENHKKNILKVICDEATQCKPNLTIKPDSIALTTWLKSLPNETGSLTLSTVSLSFSELSLVLKVRESIKMTKSGVTNDKIVALLFNGNIEAYNQSLLCVLGEN